MQVSTPNDVKIYNLSAGRSLPDWLSEKKRRKLKQQDGDIRRRIELLQDFSMPHVSNLVKVTRDNQYVMATGLYKPRLKVFDTEQMSMKYEKCMDSHAIQFCNLESDYTKVAILQDERYLEFHHKYGMFYRTRIPKYGRDMAYHFPSCDLYITAYGDEVYRLNLEQGKFLNSLKTNSSEVTCCEFNPEHQLFTCGTGHGQVECWDPRTRYRVGLLDCALARYQEGDISEVPKVTSIKYKGGLTLGVGTSTGQVLLYDIRSLKPTLIKDHNYELPIKSIKFTEKDDIVLSMDKRIIKMWDQHTGKAYTHIEPEDTSLNDLCLVPGSGLLFVANEAPKILSYYVPSLGPAPRWCSFLDNITEELEETSSAQVYDDYKFVTRAELDEMNLAGLIGTDLLRGYMHGFFMDNRLYKKAKSVAEPFAYQDYRKKKIRQKIEADREDRVKATKNLPTVNKELAAKLMQNNAPNKSLLKDDRFASLFKDPEYNIDEESKEYKAIHHNVAKMTEKAAKKQKKIDSKFAPVPEAAPSAFRGKHKVTVVNAEPMGTKPKFFEIKEGDSLKDLHATDKPKKSKLSLKDRLMSIASSKETITHNSGFGAKEMTFQTSKGTKTKSRKGDHTEHRKERAKLRRSAGVITKHTIKPMWKPQS